MRFNYAIYIFGAIIAHLTVFLLNILWEYCKNIKKITQNVVYKFVASVDGYPHKVYLGTAEGDFK